MKYNWNKMIVALNGALATFAVSVTPFLTPLQAVLTAGGVALVAAISVGWVSNGVIETPELADGDLPDGDVEVEDEVFVGTIGFTA